MYIAVALVVTASNPYDFELTKLHPKPFASHSQCKGYLEGYAMEEVFKRVRRASRRDQEQPTVFSYEPFDTNKKTSSYYKIEHKDFRFVIREGGSKDNFILSVAYKGERDDEITKFECMEIEVP